MGTSALRRELSRLPGDPSLGSNENILSPLRAVMGLATGAQLVKGADIEGTREDKNSLVEFWRRKTVFHFTCDFQ